MLGGRKQDRERRKTQEIALMRSNDDLKSTGSSTRLSDGTKSRTDSTLSKTDAKTPVKSATPTVATNEENVEAPTMSEEGAIWPGEMMQRCLLAMNTRRTPSFQTRRAVSLRKVRAWDELASIEKYGYTERKQELQSGGKRATIRSWKTHYTIVCGQLMCFFKDEESFMENTAAAPPVYIYQAICRPHSDYSKRKNCFKLCTNVRSLALY